VISADDDGPCIPDEELVPIEPGVETPLRHGRELGPLQLRDFLNDLDGILSFETDDGTTVRIIVSDRSEREPDRRPMSHDVPARRSIRGDVDDLGRNSVYRDGQFLGLKL
jgi:hypothetical protein